MSLDPIELSRINLVVPDGYLLTQLEKYVETTFFKTLDSLECSGVTIEQEPLPAIEKKFRKLAVKEVLLLQKPIITTSHIYLISLTNMIKKCGVGLLLVSI